MCDVDNMDIFYYLEVLAYRIKNNPNDNNKKEKEKEVYIDEVSWL